VAWEMLEGGEVLRIRGQRGWTIEKVLGVNTELKMQRNSFCLQYFCTSDCAYNVDR